MNVQRSPERTFVFVDTETTGLDPTAGALLEIGFIITDSNLTELARKNWVFSVDRAAVEDAFTIDQVVQDMHVKSGLWTACAGVHGHSRASLDGAIVAWLREHGIVEDDSHPLFGSTVAFDRSWMKVHLPKTEAVFGYRNPDFSTFKELLKRWKVEDLGVGPEPTKREIHRALPDLEDTIELAWYYRRLLF